MNPSNAIRTGLPRKPGDGRWPESVTVETSLTVAPTSTQPVLLEATPTAAIFRQGLPRSKGGAAWPEVDTVAEQINVAPTIVPSAMVGIPEVLTPSVASMDPHSPLSRVGLPRGTNDAWPVQIEVPEEFRFSQKASPAVEVAMPVEDARAETVVASVESDVPSDPPAKAGLSPRAKSLIRILVFAPVSLILLYLIDSWVVSLPAVQNFMKTYPGEYALPSWAPEGLPVWLNWQHYLNFFFMVLVIRTGWRIHSESRPAAYWTSKRSNKKVSLTIWTHQALDLVWIVNGLIFVVLLFVTGQWIRVVPSSLDVIPNALTAGMKYLSLHWPTENGWVNYNSLQQITYFITIFIAAPLAALTGYRLSNLWPTKAKTLSRVYPVEVARAIHLPVMVYFVLFIIVHVTLVLSTGALRNLNHMYGSQDDVNWVGFSIFAGGLVAIGLVWWAMKPSIVAPIASLFGKVSRQ